MVEVESLEAGGDLLIDLQVRLAALVWQQGDKQTIYGHFEGARIAQCSVSWNKWGTVGFCFVVKWSLLWEGVGLTGRFSLKHDQVICS